MEVDQLVGQLPGKTTYLNAAPVPESGRTGRATCGYGVVEGPDGTALPAPVELSVIAYADAAKTRERVEITVDAARKKGDAVEKVSLDRLSGYILVGADSTTFVVARDDRTYVATLLSVLAQGDQAKQIVAALGAAMLTEASPASTPPSPVPPSAPTS